MYIYTYRYTHAHGRWTFFLPSILFLPHSFLLAGGVCVGRGGGGVVRRATMRGITLRC